MNAADAHWRNHRICRISLQQLQLTLSLATSPKVHWFVQHTFIKGLSCRLHKPRKKRHIHSQCFALPSTHKQTWLHSLHFSSACINHPQECPYSTSILTEPCLHLTFVECLLHTRLSEEENRILSSGAIRTAICSCSGCQVPAGWSWSWRLPTLLNWSLQPIHSMLLPRPAVPVMLFALLAGHLRAAQVASVSSEEPVLNTPPSPASSPNWLALFSASITRCVCFFPHLSHYNWNDLPFIRSLRKRYWGTVKCQIRG